MPSTSRPIGSSASDPQRTVRSCRSAVTPSVCLGEGERFTAIVDAKQTIAHPCANPRSLGHAYRLNNDVQLGSLESFHRIGNVLLGQFCSKTTANSHPPYPSGDSLANRLP